MNLTISKQSDSQQNHDEAEVDASTEYCTRCNNPLAVSQIGKCDSCQADDEPTSFTNHYLCPCGHEWEDAWDCGCNDRCSQCNREIEPYASDDGSMTHEEIDAARKAAVAAQSK